MSTRHSLDARGHCVGLALLATVMLAGCAPWYVQHGLSAEAVRDPRMVTRMVEIVASRGPGSDEAALAVAAQCDAPTMIRLLPDIVRALGESDGSPCWEDRPSDWLVHARCEPLLRCTATLGEPAARTLTALLLARTDGTTISDDESTLRTRWLTVLLLGSLRSAAASAAPELTDILDHDHIPLRRAAALVLGAINTSWPPALAALDRAANKGDDDLRGVAATTRRGLSPTDGEQRAALDQQRQFVTRWRLAETVAHVGSQRRGDNWVLVAGAILGVPSTAAVAGFGGLLRSVRGEGLDAYVGLLGVSGSAIAAGAGLVVTLIGAISHGVHSAKLRRIERARRTANEGSGTGAPQ